MKNRTGLFVIVVMSIFGSMFPSVSVKAEDTAVFRVQAAEEAADGTIKISVYMSDISNLGGIDAELVYDAEKVTYVSSGLGAGFLDGYGLTHCDEAASTIKCVAVYPEAKNTQGELLHAVFRLNNIESYQPEFKVIDLLDASIEIKPIPYMISYQQTDGSWREEPDGRGEKAAAEIVNEARELYASELDKERLGSEYPEDETAEELLEEKEEEMTAETKGSVVDEKKEEKEKIAETVDVKAGDDKSEKGGVAYAAGSVILAAFVLVIGLVKGRRRRYEE